MYAVEISSHGGPEALQFVNVDVAIAGDDDIVVKVGAAGVNFIDTYHRSGLYEVPLPFRLGREGAGTVTEIGAAVTSFRIGDRVAWAGGTGSYAEFVTVAASEAVHVPEGVEDRDAAALMLQGMTAHYLVTDTYSLGPGSSCLIHAGAGGMGLLLTQMAKHLGAKVFTTVSTEAKAELSRAAGADHVVVYSEVDFAQAIEQIAGPRPLDVVYDGVGKSVFEASLGLIRRRGTMVTFGNASGAVDPISPLVLNTNGSLFLTRPKLDDYIATRQELEARSGEVMRWARDGVIKTRIGLELPLEQAQEAHRQLESRTTTGKVLLIP